MTGGQASSAGRNAALAALQAALAAEQAASFGYGIVGAHLSGQRWITATDDWVAHQRGRDQLTSMITARGGQPVPSAVGYQLPAPVRSAAAAAALAATLEDAVARAYLGLVALPDAALRDFGARHGARSRVAGAVVARFDCGLPRLARNQPDGLAIDSPARPAAAALPRRGRVTRRGAGGSQHPLDQARRALEVLAPGDPLGPGPPEPPQPILPAARVDILGQRRRRRVHYMQAGNAAGRRDQAAPASP